MAIKLSTAVLCLTAVLCPLMGAADVTVVQSEDRSVSVTTSVYRALIDSRGNLTEVSVRDAKSISSKFGPSSEPGSAAPTINVVDRLVAIRSGTERVEYTFAEEAFHVLTEGYSFAGQLDASVVAVVVPGGKGGPAANVYANSSAVVLSNGLTAAWTVPFHAGNGRMFPSCYVNGTGVKPGDQIEFDVRLGAPVEAIELLSGIGLTPVGSSYGTLKEGGNEGYGIVHFPDGTGVVYTSTQQNLSTTSMKLEYRLSILDHYVDAKEVAKSTKYAELPAGGKAELTWNIPKLAPGFYYLTLSAWKGATKLTESKQTLAVDLSHYTHPLTRPKDFKSFWNDQNALLRKTPMNPVVTLVSPKERSGKVFEVQLDMPGGNKLHGCLIIPAGTGPMPITVGSLNKIPLSDMISKAKLPDYPITEASFTAELPEDGTYRRWNSREDNNYLDCVLTYLRGIDFVATLPEIDPKRLIVLGSSRSGGLTLIAAALRSDNVCAADGHVDTSCGVSWEDKPYRGWGQLPPASDEVEASRYRTMAAYVDPVNFAPDVKCPVVTAWGLDDDLSRPQGIEAAYNMIPAKWKRISRDGGGHQYSQGFQKIKKELYEFLKTSESQAVDQSSTLKQH